MAAIQAIADADRSSASTPLATHCDGGCGAGVGEAAGTGGGGGGRVEVWPSLPAVSRPAPSPMPGLAALAQMEADGRGEAVPATVNVRIGSMHCTTPAVRCFLSETDD